MSVDGEHREREIQVEIEKQFSERGGYGSLEGNLVRSSSSCNEGSILYNFTHNKNEIRIKWRRSVESTG